MNRRSIFRVPPNLRKVDSNVYDPKLISLGPYHRRDVAVEETNEWKERYFTRFFNRTPHPRPLKLDVGLIDDLEQDARNSYAETIDMNRQEFMEMMLRDGCFILEVLINPLDIVASSLVVEDMFLVENQVPFIILERLFELVLPNPHNDTLVGIARKFMELFLQVVLERPPNNPERPPNNPDNNVPLHLLDVLYSCMKANGLANNEVRVEINEEEEGMKANGLANNEVRVELNEEEEGMEANGLANNEVGVELNEEEEGMEANGLASNEVRVELSEEEEGMTRSIPSARRLVEAGIRFKKTARGTPFKASFEVVVLEMSPLKIHDGTETILQNMIAFERYYLNARRVLDYMYLVNCLVDSIEDVKVLGKSGVLVNRLGSEEKVVDAIKRISRNFTWGYRSENGYERLFLGVNRYCRSPYASLRTNLVQMLSNSLFWRMLGFLGAFYGLWFTILQSVGSYGKS